MNCDQVFDVLTRGPFPTGDAGDAAVERHLAACHECRELAVALAPGVELFHEALAFESYGLPGYRGVYSHTGSTGLAAAVEAALADEAPTPAAALAHSPVSAGPWGVVAALSIGAIVGALLMGLIWQGPRPLAADPANQSAGEPRFQPSDSGRQWLVSLALPGACLPTQAATLPLNRHGEMRYACCLDCHGASERRPPLEAQAALDRSCHVCHNY